MLWRIHKGLTQAQLAELVGISRPNLSRFGRDTYSYVWGRDGAYVAVALAKAGYSEVCRRFFKFCTSLLTDEGFLFQHYMPDGAVASNWHPWIEDGENVLPIQEDSTALLIWALWQHFECAKDIEFIKSLYQPLIQKAANFLVDYRDPKTHLPHPSYDLWEERRGVHAFTVASVYAGLKAAANFAETFKDDNLETKYRSAAEEIKEALPRYLYNKDLKRYARSGKRTESGYKLDDILDISLAGLVTLGITNPEDPSMVRTLASIQEQLRVKTKVGGYARHERDIYQATSEPTRDIPGNPWFISTLWLAEYNIVRARSLDELKQAIPLLEWCAHKALPSGVLAEQIHPKDGRPLSVAPLTWSHSSFVWAVLQYVEKFNSLASIITNRSWSMN